MLLMNVICVAAHIVNLSIYILVCGSTQVSFFSVCIIIFSANLILVRIGQFEFVLYEPNLNVTRFFQNQLLLKIK
jgi:hypothetical protein